MAVRRANHYTEQAIDKDDYDGQMIVGEPCVLKLPDICLTGAETPPPQKSGNLSQLGIEPGPAA